ncbi:hypothetical protein MSAN_00011300 [Mycena sanguinolenta]|uniref:Uncharacterized protein n=1 Tax=Mycena sanguinolenta TaxID=230812 RepID=A0A8H6ZEK1_9AGAR|nr:hypothetical protein MSAN_00011300 [Mycena sanguinolenta]
MAPKGHRAAPVPPRHSRSTSATKLPINLQFTQKKAPPRPNLKQPQQPPKQRGGFHIASPGEDDDDDDDDGEWVSSESGQVTPNPHNDDDSDLDSGESNEPPHRAELPRVATARPSDYKIEPQRRPTATQVSREPSRSSRTESNGTNGMARPSEANGNAPRISTESNGNQSCVCTRSSAASLTASRAPNRLLCSPSPSPPTPHSSPRRPRRPPRPPSSPTSPAAPPSPPPAPSQPSPHPTPPRPPRSIREGRHRTLSAAPSSAALSSLAHLPAVSRPPFTADDRVLPARQPPRPHRRYPPLLPPPYVSNHLTVLARRTPIREAFDRVVRARQSVRT